MFISHSKIGLNYRNAYLLNADGKRESIIMFAFLLLNIKAIVIIHVYMYFLCLTVNRPIYQLTTNLNYLILRILTKFIFNIRTISGFPSRYKKVKFCFLSIFQRNRLKNGFKMNSMLQP